MATAPRPVAIAMVIGLLQVTLSIPEARSLKDKRAVLRSLRDRCLNRMNVSFAEVGDQHLWQSARLAFVTVAAEKVVAEKRLAELSQFLTKDPRYILVEVDSEFL